MPELRECAHCGGEPDLAITKSVRFDVKRYECFCFDCGFSGGKHELMEDAVLTWNARPENKEEKFYSLQQP